MSNLTVEDHIVAQAAPIAETLNWLRQLILGELKNGTEKMKYGAPVYWNASGKEVVYLYGGKDHANLGFLHGVDLDDPDGILEGTGKNGRHVKGFPGKEPSVAALKTLLVQTA